MTNPRINLLTWFGCPGVSWLHAPKIAGADRFLTGLRDHAKTKSVHGECGYMVLGKCLVDKDGVSHQMADFLDLLRAMKSESLIWAIVKLFRNHHF